MSTPPNAPKGFPETTQLFVGRVPTQLFDRRTLHDVGRDVFPPNFSSGRVSNKSRKKVDSGRLRWSLTNQKTIILVSNQRCTHLSQTKVPTFKTRKESAAARSRKQSKTKSKKQSTTVIYGSHSHRSLTRQKAFSQPSEPRGWRRWPREALFNNKDVF